MLVARKDLARPTGDAIASAHELSDSSAAENAQGFQSEVWGFVSLLRKTVEPYLNGGRPDVAFVAEIAGVSPRTLQRRLELCGSSYSRILQEARFGLACSRLAESDMKVIDVAFMAGYDSPQHFTRAFHRFTGVTPTAYRRHTLGGGAGV